MCLQGKPARAAVNMPSVPPDVLARIEPYLMLAEKIGSLHAQFTSSSISEVEVVYAGDFDNLPTVHLTRAVLKGLLEPIIPESVNYVNAPALAAARGIKVTESRTPAGGKQWVHPHRPQKVERKAAEREICGTVFSRDNVRILYIDGFRVDIRPAGPMLVTKHTDRPGIIGKVGTLHGRQRDQYCRHACGPRKRRAGRRHGAEAGYGRPGQTFWRQSRQWMAWKPRARCSYKDCTPCRSAGYNAHRGYNRHETDTLPGSTARRNSGEKKNPMKRNVLIIPALLAGLGVTVAAHAAPGPIYPWSARRPVSPQACLCRRAAMTKMRAAPASSMWSSATACRSQPHSGNTHSDWAGRARQGQSRASMPRSSRSRRPRISA